MASSVTLEVGIVRTSKDSVNNGPRSKHAQRLRLFMHYSVSCITRVRIGLLHFMLKMFETDQFPFSVAFKSKFSFSVASSGMDFIHIHHFENFMYLLKL